MADDDIQSRQKPSLNLPKSDSTVEVSIINTTTEIVVPAWTIVQPVLKGHETMNMPTFAFLIKNKKLGKSILFDLGCRKDWWNFAPAAHNVIKNGIPGLNVPKNINEVLEDGKEDVVKIGGIIWSHWHWVNAHRIQRRPSCPRPNENTTRWIEAEESFSRIIQEIPPSFPSLRRSSLVQDSRMLFCPGIVECAHRAWITDAKPTDIPQKRILQYWRRTLRT